MGRSIRENKEEMAAMYTDIANNVVGELPQNWTKVAVSFAIENQEFETFLVYYSEDHGKTYRNFVEEAFEFDEPAEGLFEAQESCQKLHALCKRHGDNWTQFTLVVDRQGDFTADFTYEPIETFTRLHLQVWRGRYLK